MGLDSTGLTTPRLAELLEQVKALFRAEFGDDVDLGPDEALGQLAGIIASGQDDLYRLTRALYDAIHPDNAEGILLDNLAGIQGLVRNPAVRATGTVTVSGDAGTVIPGGKLVADQEDITYRTLAAVTIGAGGTADAEVEAEELGPASPGAGEVDQIITPVSGWDSVTNAAAFSAGQAAETDAELRLRMATSGAVQGSSTDQGLRAKLAALDYVDAVQVISNRTLTTDADGIPGKAFRAVLHPSGLSASQEQEVARIIWENAPAGIEIDGSEAFTVTDSQGYVQTVAFSYATEVNLVVEVDVTTRAAFPSDGLEQVKAAALAYVMGIPEDDLEDKPALASLVGSGLSVGDDVIVLGLIQAIATVPGLTGVTLRLNDKLIEADPTNTASLSIGSTSIARLAEADIDVQEV